MMQPAADREAAGRWIGRQASARTETIRIWVWMVVRMLSVVNGLPYWDIATQRADRVTCTLLGLRYPRPTILFRCRRPNLVRFGYLTRRANQVHIGTIADFVSPRLEWSRAFTCHKTISRAVSIYRDRLVEFSAIC
jgi:hypothetical protein